LRSNSNLQGVGAELYEKVGDDHRKPPEEKKIWAWFGLYLFPTKYNLKKKINEEIPQQWFNFAEQNQDG